MSAEAWKDAHVSRTFGTSTPLEDECPCPQEPCGHVVLAKAHPDCPHHKASKTMRNVHPAAACPALCNADTIEFAT